MFTGQFLLDDIGVVIVAKKKCSHSNLWEPKHLIQHTIPRVRIKPRQGHIANDAEDNFPGEKNGSAETAIRFGGASVVPHVPSRVERPAKL